MFDLKSRLPKQSVSKMHFALFVIVALLVVIVIVQAAFPSSLQNYFSPITKTTESLNILDNPNITQFDIGNSKIGLPSKWSISAILGSVSATGYYCMGTSCRIALVSPVSGGNNLNVALSTPGQLRLRQDLGLSDMDLAVKVFGKNLKFSAQYYQTSELSDTTTLDPVETKSDMVYQVFGCISEYLCVHAGPFSIDSKTNAAQLAGFQSLMAGLKLTK